MKDLNNILREKELNIYKFIKPINELKLNNNSTIVFDIESCGLENNTRALTYSIGVMKIKDCSDTMYWCNTVKDFFDAIFSDKNRGKHFTTVAHNCYFDIKPFLTYFLDNYSPKRLMPELIKEKVYDYSDRQTKTVNVLKPFNNKKDINKNECYYDILIKKNIFYSATFYCNNVKLVFKDSFKIAPYSLQKCAKDFLGLKLSKGGLDYEKERSLDDELTIEELKYIYEDVFSLKYLVKLLIIDGVDMNGKKIIYDCLTNSAQSLKNYKETLLDDFINHKNAFENEDLRKEVDNILILNKFYSCKNNTQKANKVFRALFPELSIGLHNFLSKGYYGGLSMVDFKNVEKFSKLDNHNGIVLDVNSLYPSTMLEYMLPYGKCIVNEKPYKDLPDSFKKQYPLYVQEIEIEELDLKPNKAPFLQVKGSPYFNGKEALKNNKDEDGIRRKINVLLVKPLYELLFENYNINCFTEKRCFCFKGTKKLFQNYIEFWSKIKQENTGSLRAIAKLRQNGLYGKFGTSTLNTIEEYYSDDDKFSVEHTGIEYHGDNIYLPMSMFITGYARAFLVRAINNNHERFMYCDTDSLHLYGSLDEVKGVTIHDKNYSCWKHEASFIDFKYLGSKRYAEMIKQEDDEYKWVIKCCGLNDKILNKIEDIETFEYSCISKKKLDLLMDKGIIFPGEDKEDIHYYYTDGSKVKGIFKNKKSKVVKGGTLILEQPYILTETSGQYFDR